MPHARAPRAAAALVNAVLHEVLRRLRSVDDRVEREIASKSDGIEFKADAYDNEDRSSLRPGTVLPETWESAFGAVAMVRPRGRSAPRGGARVRRFSADTSGAALGAEGGLAGGPADCEEPHP